MPLPPASVPSLIHSFLHLTLTECRPRPGGSSPSPRCGKGAAGSPGLLAGAAWTWQAGVPGVCPSVVVSSLEPPLLPLPCRSPLPGRSREDPPGHRVPVHAETPVGAESSTQRGPDCGGSSQLLLLFWPRWTEAFSTARSVDTEQSHPRGWPAWREQVLPAPAPVDSRGSPQSRAPCSFRWDLCVPGTAGPAPGLFLLCLLSSFSY